VIATFDAIMCHLGKGAERMHTTRRHRRARRSRLRSILLVGGAAVLSAAVIGMRRRSSRTVPTQAVLFTETEMRERLLKDLPVTERRLDLAGVSTSLLGGGEGPLLVLLHGQGGFAAMWGRVIPHLVGGYRIVAPDLPGLGHSEVRADNLDAPRAVAWLGALIEQTCTEPPILVGHSLGGSFAAHFAIEHSDRLRGIVLVDSGSLGRFRPAPAVLAALLRFSARPSPVTHERFLQQVFFDSERARAGWGERWEAFEAYHIDRAGQPSVGTANRQLLRRIGVRRIKPDQLQKIGVPVALIWGKNDPVMRFRIAEKASVRFGWPLHPIDDCGHVPHVERSEAFLEALHAAIAEM
jgi:pimeloyl-ACP methyl ester carboxylesterase